MRYLGLYLLLVPMTVYADLTTVDDHESKMVQKLVTSSTEVGAGGLFNGDFDIRNLEYAINQYDPELIEKSKNEDDKTKRILYRSRITKSTFDFLKDYFVKQIETASDTEDREILITNENDKNDFSTEYRLDDSKYLYDCGYPPSRQGIESAKFCYYKTGHTFFYIQHNISKKGEESLYINKENITDNTSTSYFFMLTVHDSEPEKKYGMPGQYALTMTVVDQPYDEMFAQRNQMTADELNGMTELVGKFCDQQERCRTVYSVKEPKKWKSSRIPPFKFKNTLVATTGNTK